MTLGKMQTFLIFLLKSCITFLLSLVQDKHQTWNLTIIILGESEVNLYYLRVSSFTKNIQWNLIKYSAIPVLTLMSSPWAQMLGEVLKAGSWDASWGFLGSVRLSKEHLCSFVNTHNLAELTVSLPISGVGCLLVIFLGEFRTFNYVVNSLQYWATEWKLNWGRFICARVN